MNPLFLAAMPISATLVPQLANALEKPTGRIIRGTLDDLNQGESVVFDLPMIEALDGRSGTLNTPWLAGKTTFSRPLQSALLDAVGAHGKSRTMMALNDYSPDLLIEDALTLKTILATRTMARSCQCATKAPWS